MKNKSYQTYTLLLSACLAALLINTAASWFFYSRWDEVEEQFSQLVSQQSATSSQLEQTETALRTIYPELLILRDPDYRIITLTSAEEGVRAQCRIYWNSYTRKTYLDPLSLTDPDSGKWFRIWCQVQQEFIPVADITDSINDDQLMLLGQVAAAESWLISEENVGDSLVKKPGRIIQRGQ